MKVIVIALSLFFAQAAYAAEISGTISVLYKSGKKPLKSFANAVVYLEGVETAPPAEAAIINQTKKRFKPRLLPIVKGQEVRFPNADRLHHNVFSPHKEEAFDLGRYAKGEGESVTLTVLGPHKIYCNIHQKMVADIYVLPNQYFGVTDKEGKYIISDVPPGEYTLKAWHIYGGTAEQQVQVTDDQTLVVELSMTSQKRVREIRTHKNKFGSSYQDKRREKDGY